MSEAPGRLVLVGLDVGDPSLLAAWIARGRLPNLERLAAGGVRRPLASTADTLHISAWPSLYTGAGPGEHGVYFTFQPVPGEQGHRRFHPGLYGRATFWRRLGEAGVPCTVLDAPYTQLEDTAGVVQVVDWGAWARYLGPRSDPATALRRLRRQVGDYPLGFEAHDVGLEAILPERIGPALVRAVSAKTEAALWMLDEYPAPLFFAVYGEPHAAAHYCWPQGMSAAEVREAVLGEAPLPPGLGWLLDVYEEIDRGIGRIVDALPEDATVCVFSPDAAGPNYGGWHLLPEVLRRLGYLAEAAPPAPDAPEAEAEEGRARPGLVRRVRDLVPRDLRKAVARRLPTALRDRLARSVDSAFIDWSRTRAFCLPTDLEGCIRINLAGREPLGVVPQSEYEALCDAIARDLAELRDEAGQRAVREVVRVRDRYPGERTAHLPDLVVLWEHVGQLQQLRGDSIGIVAGESPDGRPGTHATPGFLIVRGPDAGSEWAAVRDVQDIAGLVLRRFGVDVPSRDDADDGGTGREAR